MHNFKKLDIWIKSMDLASEIYLLTNSFPSIERFGLISQMQRSAVSIPSNIAEGSGRFSDKELVRFLFISLGSASELETQLIISQRLEYINNDEFEKISHLTGEIIRMLAALIKSKNNGLLYNSENI